MAIRDQVTERTVELSTNKAHFYETGSGYPTIFIHGVGFTSSGEDWFGCIKEGIGDTVHVIAIDQLGWGRADRPSWRYSFAYLVDHIRELQDALGYEKTNLVGHSLGGWVAGTLAYESPERVNKLVLVANAGLNVAPPPNLAQFSPPSEADMAAGLAGVEDDELRAELLETRIVNANTTNGVAAYERLSEMFVDTDMRKRMFLTRRLSRIKAPTLLVFGENDLIFPPLEGRDLMQKEIPDNRCVILPGAGHFIPTERPKDLTRLLREFLA